MEYRVAETFVSVQGEGLYAGTPMAFIRLVGCSVSKRVCNYCDTDFDAMYPWKGGGHLSARAIAGYAEHHDVSHVCLTGGEPLDWDLRPIFMANPTFSYHIETSGTVHPDWLQEAMQTYQIHLTVSPKPGWQWSMLELASEIKVIVGGLGTGDGWPTLMDAVLWSTSTHIHAPVYIQPCNKKHEVDALATAHAVDLVKKYPTLRLSVQLHKYLKVS